MHRGRRTVAVAASAVAALAAFPAAASAAEALYGVTDAGRAITLNSSAPGNIERSVAIRGLQPGERVLGIDVRPVNDAVYALGSSSRVYQLNPVTGALRAVGAGGPFATALNGTEFGFDFNPTVDRIRITSNTGQDLRVNPDTGAVAAVDGVLGYAAGDAGTGTVPSVGGSGYSNSTPGATATQLFDIDTARDALVLQDPPNTGTLRTVGPLGVAVGGPLGFDIGTGNIGWAAMRPTAGGTAVNLYRVDLATGRATPATATPAIGTQNVVALAAGGTVADDDDAPTDSVAVSSTQSESRLLSQGLLVSVSSDEAASVRATVAAAGGSAASGTATIADRAGRTTVTLRLSAAARAAIRRPGTLLMTLSVTVTDTAGNASTQRRSIRTR
jgi:hypothetical protein